MSDKTAPPRRHPILDGPRQEIGRRGGRKAGCVAAARSPTVQGGRARHQPPSTERSRGGNSAVLRPLIGCLLDEPRTAPGEVVVQALGSSLSHRMPFVCVQPMLTSWSRRAEDLTVDKTDEKDAVLVARLTA